MTTPPPPPAYYPPSSFAPPTGLAWASLILGIIGVVFSLIPYLNMLTMLGALVGIVLGVIALFGSRKVPAGIGVGLCVLAVVVSSLVIRFTELDPISGSPSDPPPGSTGYSSGSSYYSPPPPVAGPLPLPEPSDFTIEIKVLRKACFGSYGCDVTYQIDPTYTGTTPLTGRTFTVIYEVTGSEDGPRINNFETNSDGTASLNEQELTRTSSPAATLKAKVTSVSEN
jgi:hypothetical protein